MAKLLSSPLISLANNIVPFNPGSSSSLIRRTREFKDFTNFLEIERFKLEKIGLPDKKQISKLANLNLQTTFGSSGRLLRSLASGALDISEFLGREFPVKGKMGKPSPVLSANKTTRPTPQLKGSRIRLGGLRAAGVASALFAGLDFATGLQEGESVGKAAAGAGGSLAGSLLGGAIGQALIPIPGVGFALGSMAGQFLGGYAADRVYEGGSALKDKLSGKIKKQELAQMDLVRGNEGFAGIVDKFSGAVGKFEQGVASGLFGSVPQNGRGQTKNKSEINYEPDTESIDTGNSPESTGLQIEDVEASGGEVPGTPYSGFRTSDRPNHKGNDYSKNVGTPISLIQEGTVTVADMNYNPGGWGSLVEVRHKDGSLSRYAHLSKISVSAGSEISPGQVIGYTGGAAGAYGAGNSTGPHLHFEYLPSGSGQVDPTQAAKRIFRFGGNVKVKPKAGVSGTESNVFNLEIHATAANEKQRSGLMPSYLDPLSKVSKDFISNFGQYSRSWRVDPKTGKGLGMLERGGNILETAMEEGVDENAKKIFDVIKNNPKTHFNTYAGHNDVTKGELGAPGERNYNRLVAEKLEQMTKDAKLKNFTYLRSIIANNDNDPNANWNRVAASRKSGLVQPAPQAQVVPAAAPSVPQVQTYPTYNQPQSSVTVMPIMMGGGNRGGGGQQQKPVYIPVGGGGGGGTVILPGPSEGQVVNSLVKTLLLTTLSAS